MAHWPSADTRHQSVFPQMGQQCARLTRCHTLDMGPPPFLYEARDRHHGVEVTAGEKEEAEVDEIRFLPIDGVDRMW
jgi:hypothetical protein